MAETSGPGSSRRRRKAKDVADDALHEIDVEEGRAEPEAALETPLEPVVTSPEVEAAISAPGPVAQASKIVRIRWKVGNRKGKCSNVGYKLARVQISLGRAEYADDVGT